MCSYFLNGSSPYLTVHPHSWQGWQQMWFCVSHSALCWLVWLPLVSLSIFIKLVLGRFSAGLFSFSGQLWALWQDLLRISKKPALTAMSLVYCMCFSFLSLLNFLSRGPSAVRVSNQSIVLHKKTWQQWNSAFMILNLRRQRASTWSSKMPNRVSDTRLLTAVCQSQSSRIGSRSRWQRTPI